METPNVEAPSGRLKMLRQICHLAAADFAKLFLIMCQIVSAKRATKRLFSPLRTTLICKCATEQSAVRRLASSCTILQLNSKTYAHCSPSLSQQHNHWIAACLYCQRAHTHTHSHSGGWCVSETSVKPKFWLDCHVLRAAAFS